jgi:DNA-binding CsgD family transcriptional regulator
LEKNAKKYNSNSLIELYFSIGKLKEQQKKYGESLDAYNKSLAVAENSGNLNGQMRARYGLYKVNEKSNHLREAISQFQKYVTLKDSISNKETKTIIARLEEKYKNEKTLMYEQKLKEKQKADQHRKIALILGMAFFVVLLTFIFYSVSQRKKRNALEKELLKSEKDKMNEDLRYQNRQLASQALVMMQKNKMLQSIYDSLNAVPKDKESIPGFLNKMKYQVRRSIQSEKEWNLFKLYFERVNKTFFKKLKGMNHELTHNDCRLAALIKLRLNIKEAASVLNLSPNSIKGARHRLRVKLGLKSQEDLEEFIVRID